MPDEIVFNKELKLDLMYLMVDGKQIPTLSIVDAGTTFSAASFLTLASSMGRISEVLDDNVHRISYVHVN
jgi:hypothetical protein